MLSVRGGKNVALLCLHTKSEATASSLLAQLSLKTTGSWKELAQLYPTNTYQR